MRGTCTGKGCFCHDEFGYGLCVYHALSAKGYDPITQIVGYLLSGDPTYITSYQNARSLICRIDRDELLEELVQFYLSKNV